MNDAAAKMSIPRINSWFVTDIIHAPMTVTLGERDWKIEPMLHTEFGVCFGQQPPLRPVSRTKSVQALPGSTQSPTCVVKANPALLRELSVLFLFNPHIGLRNLTVENVDEKKIVVTIQLPVGCQINIVPTLNPTVCIQFLQDSLLGACLRIY
jgi:hypothetical protein